MMTKDPIVYSIKHLLLNSIGLIWSLSRLFIFLIIIFSRLLPVFLCLKKYRGKTKHFHQHRLTISSTFIKNKSNWKVYCKMVHWIFKCQLKKQRATEKEMKSNLIQLYLTDNIYNQFISFIQFALFLFALFFVLFFCTFKQQKLSIEIYRKNKSLIIYQQEKNRNT